MSLIILCFSAEHNFKAHIQLHIDEEGDRRRTGAEAPHQMPTVGSEGEPEKASDSVESLTEVVPPQSPAKTIFIQCELCPHKFNSKILLV